MKKIGVLDVDSGCVYLGDPCYFLHKEKKDIPKVFRNNWEEFCEKTLFPSQKEEPVTILGHSDNPDSKGLGLVVSTTYGDGTYNVYGNFDNRGQLVGIYIDLSGENDEAEEIY